jgi:Ca2+-binding RTX toxin-like protein
MFGGAGRDTADYSSRSGNLFITQNESSTGLGRGGEADEDDVLALDVERVLGGSGDDRFNGGDGPNTYFGGDGDDTISGFGAADALHGQGGDDVIVGGFGNDFLDGGSGNDDVYGQVGNDTLLGQGGNDRLFSNDNARDTVNGGSGADAGRVDGLDVVTSIETAA